MSRLPIHTLTVCSGRETLGVINKMGERQFVALLSSTGEKLGPFQTSADAAQALATASQKQGGGA